MRIQRLQYIASGPCCCSHQGQARGVPVAPRTRTRSPDRADDDVDMMKVLSRGEVAGSRGSAGLLTVWLLDSFKVSCRNLRWNVQGRSSRPGNSSRHFASPPFPSLAHTTTHRQVDHSALERGESTAERWRRESCRVRMINLALMPPQV